MKPEPPPPTEVETLKQRLQRCKEALLIVKNTASWRLRKLAADVLKEI